MRRRRLSLIGIFLLLGVLITVSDRFGFFGLREVFWQAFGEPSATSLTVTQSSRSLIDLIRSIRGLHEETTDLKETNLRLQAQVAALEEVRHENELLRQELGFAESGRDRFQLVPVRVIGRSPATYLQFIIVDQGTSAGLAVGQAVVSQGFLIGQIIEVTASTATVQFITASQSQVPVTLTTSRATGLLHGGLAGLTWEEFIPGSTPITTGEQAVTSSLGNVVPADVPVGSVETLVTGASDIVQRARIHSPVEFGKLETIFIAVPVG